MGVIEEILNSQPVKKKRGRPRKNPIVPEELQKVIDEVKEKEELEFVDIVKEEKEKRKGYWDVKSDEDFDYFDARLSYEITGYRPINETQSLDFDPAWFTEARDAFLRTNHYCLFPRNSKAYADFWDEEYRRCRDGMFVNGYAITGDHYFFLNYYLLMDLSSAQKAGGGRTYAFPTFYVGQYEWFHYVELAKRKRMNACLMKAREIGYSEIDAAIIVNNYNCRPNTINLIVAHLGDHLNKTLEKVWRAMSFINDYTDGGFFKLRQVIDKANQKRASVYKIKDGQKIETGWMSQITGIIADKPNKIRGDRTDLLIYEEAGSWPGLTKAFTQADALVGQVGYQWGIRILGGTGGDEGGALEGLRKMYYKPHIYGILPFKHNFTPTGEETLSAFFIPCLKIMKFKEFFDKRGFVDPKKAKEFFDHLRAIKAEDPQELVTYCAEFCYTAEEAFSLEGDNKFNKVKIAEQLTRIRALKQCPPIETGYIDYIYKENKHTQENIDGFRWIPDLSGKIRILEHPLWLLDAEVDEDGKIIRPKVEKMNNLYVAGVDGIDIGASLTSEATKDPSDFCIVIKKRAYGLQEPLYVAIYKDRPQNIREAYETAMKLAQYYNCMINIEATRMSFATWARDKKYLGYFMKRPRATLQDIQHGKTNTIGTPATKAVIAHQTDLIADFVEDYCHNLWFEDSLDELSRYTDENKTHFDIVAAFGMAELADEEITGIIPKQVEIATDDFEDVGYYTDERGYKRWGVIPKENRFLNRARFTNSWEVNYSQQRTTNPLLL